MFVLYKKPALGGDQMRCLICRKMIRSDNKYNLCSNCCGRSLRSLLKDKTIDISCLKTSKEINNQRKKDKDDGSNDSLSGNPKQLQRETSKDEHMSASVDNHVDTDNLTKTSKEASRIDGCRTNPQDRSGGACTATKEDNGDCTLPADLKLITECMKREDSICGGYDIILKKRVYCDDCKKKIGEVPKG